VEPRGFEPLTSAVQSRHDTLLQISGVCETAASTRIPHTTLFLGFRDIHSGCCTKRAWSKADTSSLSTVIAAPESA
jgi:hypothetical protein